MRRTWPLNARMRYAGGEIRLYHIDLAPYEPMAFDSLYEFVNKSDPLWIQLLGIRQHRHERDQKAI